MAVITAFAGRVRSTVITDQFSRRKRAKAFLRLVADAHTLRVNIDHAIRLEENRLHRCAPGERFERALRHIPLLLLDVDTHHARQVLAENLARAGAPASGCRPDDKGEDSANIAHYAVTVSGRWSHSSLFRSWFAYRWVTPEIFG